MSDPPLDLDALERWWFQHGGPYVMPLITELRATRAALAQAEQARDYHKSVIDRNHAVAEEWRKNALAATERAQQAEEQQRFWQSAERDVTVLNDEGDRLRAALADTELQAKDNASILVAEIERLNAALAQAERERAVAAAGARHWHREYDQAEAARTALSQEAQRLRAAMEHVYEAGVSAWGTEAAALVEPLSRALGALDPPPAEAPG